MATFLELCQKAARNSGVISGVAPATTVEQTGDLQQLVQWVVDAWVRIQTHRDDWRWMRCAFSAATIPGVSEYTRATWNLTDHDRWFTDQVQAGYFPITLYRTATGVSDEGVIREVAYETWRTCYDRGVQTANRPRVYAISPSGAFLLGPTPDAVYTVKGEYYRVPQVLTKNKDTPLGLAAQYHDAIVWRALMLLGSFDESQAALSVATLNYLELLQQMERHALPEIRMDRGALA